MHPTTDAMGVVESQIEQWIRKEVAFPDKKLRGKCEKVVLRHLSVDKKAQGDVGTFPVRLEEGAEDEIAPLLHQIAEAAQNDANDIRQGVQSYAVYAYFTIDRNYCPRKIFRVSAEEEMDRSVEPSEGPTEKGLVAQTMRHLEAVMRSATITSSMQLQTMQRENVRLADMNERFAQQQVDSLILMQDLMNDATKRRLAERREESGLAMKEEAMSKLAALVPVVINRIAGKSVLPEEDRSFMLMSALLENLTEDQQAHFYSSLSDAQKITLAEVLGEYEKRKSKWLEGQKKTILGKKNELPPANPNGSSQALDAEIVTLPTELKMRDRMTAAQDSSKDPVLQKIEQDGNNFMSRFRDMIRPTPEGDRKDGK
jgi:hypothetical protein